MLPQQDRAHDEEEIRDDLLHDDDNEVLGHHRRQRAQQSWWTSRSALKWSPLQSGQSWSALSFALCKCLIVTLRCTLIPNYHTQNSETEFTASQRSEKQQQKTYHQQNRKIGWKPRRETVNTISVGLSSHEIDVCQNKETMAEVLKLGSWCLLQHRRGHFPSLWPKQNLSQIPLGCGRIVFLLALSGRSAKGSSRGLSTMPFSLCTALCYCWSKITSRQYPDNTKGTIS